MTTHRRRAPTAEVEASPISSQSLVAANDSNKKVGTSPRRSPRKQGLGLDMATRDRLPRKGAVGDDGDCLISECSEADIESSSPVASPQKCIRHEVSALDLPAPENGPLTQTREPLLQRLELLDQDLSIPIHNFDLGLFGELIMLIPASLFQPFSVPLLLVAAFFLGSERFFVKILIGT